MAEKCAQMRLPVSIASIKRAEAGKNVLYRTITSLAFFFDVSVDILFEETPLSLWQYAANQSNYSKSCIGRDIELAQLQYAFSLSSQKQVTVYMSGMRGIGKTHFVQHFLSLLTMADKTALYFNVRGTDDTLLTLARLMLYVDKDANDDIVRKRVEALTTAFLLSAYLLEMLGVSLRGTEKRALEALSADRLGKLETESVSLLVSYCIEKGIKAIAIDDIHKLQTAHYPFIQKLTHGLPPYLLLLSATNISQFTYLPSWLVSAYCIDLKTLGWNETLKIANEIVKTDKRFSNLQGSQIWQKDAIEQSCGHPGILEALLFQVLPDDFPDDFYQEILATFQALSVEQRQLLKILAMMGPRINIKTIDFVFSKMRIKGVALLHHLVCSGFVCPMSDGYCFRHIFIWEVVKAEINQDEQYKWRSVLQELYLGCIEQVIRK